jgi:RNA polymerase sigma factor (sigma-70 family)
VQLREIISLKQQFLDIESVENIIKIYEDAKPDSKSGYMRHKCVREEIARRLQPEIICNLTNEDLLHLVRFKAGLAPQNRVLVSLLKIAEKELFQQRFRGLINWSINKVLKKREFPGVVISREDLYQEGQIGLMKAIERFDFSFGYKLSTYAIRCIHSSVLRAFYDVLKSQKHNVKFVSLEEHYSPRYEDGDGEITVPDTRINQEEHLGEHQHASVVSEKLSEMVSRLPENERIVMELLFPLNDNLQEGFSIEAAAVKLGFSAGKIRHIRAQALLRMRERYNELYAQMQLINH